MEKSLLSAECLFPDIYTALWDDIIEIELENTSVLSGHSKTMSKTDLLHMADGASGYTWPEIIDKIQAIRLLSYPCWAIFERNY